MGYCRYLFSGRSTIKDLMALLAGFAVTLFFFAVYSFWQGDINTIYPVFKEHILSGQPLRYLPENIMIGVCILGIIFLISLYHIMRNYPVSVVTQRRGVSSLMTLFCFLILTVLLIPGIQLDFIYILAFPLAFTFSQYFIIQRNKYGGDIVFILFIIAILFIMLDIIL
ncbi:MAG: hypothetical protein LIO65_09145 [Odoribacter sp.]|nr:hypothetical protein [Odoribacter sp.]